MSTKYCKLRVISKGDKLKLFTQYPIQYPLLFVYELKGLQIK